jgi:putative ABC transport system ATP-binding protein
MSQSPTPIRRGADARDTEAFAKQIAASLLTQNDAPQPVSPVPETKKPLIEMHGIRKSYYIGRPNELEILHGIDLTVYPGEFVAIVGESGSGKSTLMNIIGVLDKPTAGEYALDGVNIHDAKDNQLADIRNRKIGFVFQTYNLIGRQSALKNVELPMLYAGVPGGERTRRAKEWLERVGMGERMKHQPNELSGGQKQRVAIARAMVNEPALILADEPTGALDSQTSRTVMDLFHEMHNTYHKTIVLITHNPELADECERVLTLRDGLIVGERKGSGKRAAL